MAEVNSICIIPARGGSKRVPRKNIRIFNDKPVLAYSIEAAKESGLFSRVIVSTDDSEIAQISKQLGAEVPFLRPADISDDVTGVGPVLKHALQWVMDHGELPDFVCGIAATAPFVTPQDLLKGFQLMSKEHAKMCFSVAKFDTPIQRALRLSTDGRLEMLQPQYMQTRSQDLEAVYFDAGMFYWFTSEAVLLDLHGMSGEALPVVIPRDRVQDIDTEEDWQRADFLWKLMKGQTRYYE